ncbi:MAG: pyrroline-5-carboxylate reductase [Candidatus Atribacteria bacterium]|nr:pyrroline-5-carboxylate reductase [Candidatus Atribacteria bacterium]
MEDSILFVGCGNMGSALVRGLCRDNWHKKFRFLLLDQATEKAKNLASSLNLEWVENLNNLKSSPRFVFLAVKPKDVEKALLSLRNFSQSVFVSVAAGVKIQNLEEFIPQKAIVRIMPNLCVEVGEGVVPVCFSSVVEVEEREDLLFLFSSLGWVFEAEEKDLDLFTALSGSGPGFIALFIEALADGGVKIGIPWETSLKIATQTVLGVASLLKTRGIHPAQLKNWVASPGGTTIAGIKKLEEGAFRGLVMEGVEEAYKRTKNIGEEGKK